MKAFELFGVLVGVALLGCHATEGTAGAVGVASEAQAEPKAAGGHVGTSPGHAGHGTPLTPAAGDKLAAFAAGCFWGVEDAFRHIKGVVATAPGYSGGHVDNPSYDDVCTHTTGHAETVLVEFDPKVVSYDKLLGAFFEIHDPTQGNRQGPDVGDSYRSVIFTFDEDEVTAAHAAKAKEQTQLSRPITTSIEPMKAFWIAEPYHQQYSERTGDHSCPIRAKLETL
jgi:peptide-methionine (S)-S-oxide reductase